MKFKKGDRVLVNASVYTKEAVKKQLRYADSWMKTTHEIVAGPGKDDLYNYRKSKRNLHRIEYQKPLKAIVVGWSMRQTGVYHAGRGGMYDDPGFMSDVEHHKVVLVQLTDNNRWHQPIPCLDDDLEHDSEWVEKFRDVLIGKAVFE